ncbi:hypothetical protein NC796_17930 [Aliifodinibius sp. S!AR15-10]|uniref:hypothetical protein n=1 Tax=Aliifodinibius sp. S!AR15-10 TaxID=2950437 RepID=UPI00285EDEBB|nr:hypothetical protein [Aliifodinibius sp. S!AR15-10]MDR8393041.1 hypothetical protein [Aliifodinibius sp. S!AR15-10]
MKKLHLHIGSGKTGTTSIQEIFFANNKKLNAQGFNYPGQSSEQHMLYFASKAPQEHWARTYKGIERDKLQQAVNRFFEIMTRDFQTDHQHIISTEYLFINEKEYVGNIVEFLNEYFTDVKVYLFVREPVGFYRSHQQQILKARSFIASPYTYKYDFRGVIEAWSDFFDVEVIKYSKQKNSCEELCRRIGIDFAPLSQGTKRTKASVSIEQMALLEKIQQNFYTHIDDQLNGKLHLKIIPRIQAGFTSKPKLKEWVRSVVYENHRKDLEWLKEEYGIEFPVNSVQESTESAPAFQNGKATVRDIYQVQNEETVQRYEAMVVDSLLKKLLEKTS